MCDIIYYDQAFSISILMTSIFTNKFQQQKNRLKMTADIIPRWYPDLVNYKTVVTVDNLFPPPLDI